jgi:glycine/D-amino acid oxidase-like deaminating enzyme
VRVEGGRAVGVRTSTGLVICDTVVLTTGADTPLLCAPLGFDLPVSPSPALLLRFAAPPGLVRTLVVGPGMEVREGADGELLVTAAYQGHAGRADLERTGREVLRRLTATFEGTEAVRLLGVRLGARPMPVDGLPVVGPVPGVAGAYLAVMHSGITLAPAVAPLVAAEVVHGADAQELSGVRPSRFTGGAGDDLGERPRYKDEVDR